MNTLNDNEIIQIIDDYINADNNYNYAIMLDGDWGSGKTYFVKKKLIPYIENNKYSNDNYKKVIYVSLYGITNLSALSSEVYLQTIGILKNDKLREGTYLACRIASSALENSKGIKTTGASNFIKTLINLKNFIVIFDDLERSNIDISQTLGYINNFVEHEGVKTIIITNEREISCYNESKEESKVFDETKEENNDVIKKSSDISTPYNKIKEKLIGKTIHYKPDIESIYDIFVKQIVKDECLSGIAYADKNIFLNYCKNNNHINLRTMQFALDTYSNIGRMILPLDLGENKERVVRELFHYVTITAISYRKNRKINEWTETSSDIEITNNTNGQSIVRFKFVDENILQSSLNKEYIANVVSNYIGNTLKKENDPYGKLEVYWELEDEAILGYLNQILEKLKNDEYDINKYPQIISRFASIKNVGLGEELISESLGIMEKNIINHKPKIEQFGIGVWSTNKESQTEYRIMMQQFKDLINQLNYKNIQSEIDEIFSCENLNTWGEMFYKYCRADDAIFINKHKFFSFIPIDSTIELIKQSDVINITNFRYSIYYVYDFSNLEDYYKVDIESLKEFNERLTKIDKTTFGKSKAKSIDLLIECIKESLEKLEK